MKLINKHSVSHKESNILAYIHIFFWYLLDIDGIRGIFINFCMEFA